MHHSIRACAAAFFCAILLTACTPMDRQADAPFLGEGQTVAQLHLPQAETAQIIAAWLPYFTCNTLFADPDETVCRAAVADYLQRMKALGINTVFAHVCAFGESTYPSAYYPTAPEANGHDEMQILSEECGKLGLSLHAWINPLRLQTEARMNAQNGDALLTQWYSSPILREQNLSVWNGRYYLDPASDSTGEFLAGVVSELIENYHPDGIHIDDYFYPTTDAAWDADDFAGAKQPDLAVWRRSNISSLIRQLYDTVHEKSDSTVFSISPQGNIQQNLNTLYADIPTWASEQGYCDLLVPQIYFGYQNEAFPFTETVAEWLALPRADTVSIAVGVAAYKVGEEDLYAGNGQTEWIADRNVLIQEVTDILSNPEVSGVSLYHMDAVLALPDSERDALQNAIMQNIPQ